MLAPPSVLGLSLKRLGSNVSPNLSSSSPLLLSTLVLSLSSEHLLLWSRVLSEWFYLGSWKKIIPVPDPTPRPTPRPTWNSGNAAQACVLVNRSQRSPVCSQDWQPLQDSILLRGWFPGGWSLPCWLCVWCLLFLQMPLCKISSNLHNLPETEQISSFW